MTLEEIVEKTDDLFARTIALDKIDCEIEKHIKASKQLGLNTNVGNLYHNTYCKIAKNAGFEQLNDEEIVRLISQNEVVKIKSKTAEVFTKIDFYDPLFNSSYDASLKLKYFRPPFFSRGGWENIYTVSVSSIETIIPYEVLRRIIEIKNLGIFNSFLAFVPESYVINRVLEDFYYGCWRCPDNKYSRRPNSQKSIVVVAIISKGHYIKSSCVCFKNAEFSNFFVSRWQGE